MAETRDGKGGHGSFPAPIEPRPERSRLAHWPPPFRNGKSQPKIVRHQAGEAAKLAKPRGWRLTRSMFSDD